MIIQCTNCRARFRVADSKIKKDQTKVRCAKCEQIFIAKVGENAFPDSAQPQAPPVERPKESVSPVREENREADFMAKQGPSASQPEPSVKELAMDELTASGLPADHKGKIPHKEEFPDQVTSNLPRQSVEEMAAPPAKAEEVQEAKEIEEPAEQERPEGKAIARIELKSSKEKVRPPSRHKKEYVPSRIFYLAYPLAMIVSLITGLMYAGIKLPVKNIAVLSASVPDANKTGLRILSVASYATYTIANEELFTIEGKLFNNSPVTIPKSAFQVELYSENNLFLRRATFPCCLHLSGFALHEISNLDSLMLLYRKERVDEIKPYQTLDFTLVFKKPDDEVKSFKIKITND